MVNPYSRTERNTIRRRNRRRLLALFSISLLLGLAAALYYAWILNPVVFVEASPSRLSSDHQTEYIYLIGRSYAASPDFPLAESRLAALDQPDIQQMLLTQLEAGIRAGRPLADLRALATLADALEVEAPAVALFAPSADSAAKPTTDAEQAPLPVPSGIIVATPAVVANQPTPTLIATSSPTPAAEPTATTSQFQLLNREQQCLEEVEGGHIQVLVVDANGTPQAGIPVVVSWPEGSDRFITGFKEGGYGDFTMQPDIDYTVTLPDGRTSEDNLRLEPCADDQTANWQLTFLKDEG